VRWGFKQDNTFASIPYNFATRIESKRERHRVKKVLITGVSGYIGSKIAGALLQNPAVEEIVGLDIRPPRIQSEKLLFVEQDIRAPLVDLLRTHHVDTVVHAAYVLPPIHDKALMEDINLGGTRNVLAATAETGVEHLLYTSSANAYGFHPDNEVPLTENSPLRGNDDFTYAKNKKQIKALMRAFVQDHGQMTVTILRPCFVAGPGFDNPLSRYLRKPVVFFPRRTAEFQFVRGSSHLQNGSMRPASNLSTIPDRPLRISSRPLPEKAGAMGRRLLTFFFKISLQPDLLNLNGSSA
jgi:UDP-glucose 4-epimerase